jgi:uncharacterized membrane protein
MKVPGRTVRRRLIAGLVVIAPVTITAFVLWWIFQRLDGLLGNIIYPAIGVDVPGLGLLLLLLLLFLIGWTAEWAVGARIVGWWHSFLERFPLTRRLYTASNRIVRTVFGEEQRFFREVVLVEYPGPGRWSIGFVTSIAPRAVQEIVPDSVTVFIPTAPNPTTGWVVVVPRAEVFPVSFTLEQALTFVLSAGGVQPEDAEGPATPLPGVQR